MVTNLGRCCLTVVEFRDCFQYINYRLLVLVSTLKEVHRSRFLSLVTLLPGVAVWILQAKHAVSSAVGETFFFWRKS